MTVPQRHRDWVFLIVVIAAAAPALARGQIATGYLLGSGLIFSAELVIAASMARRRSARIFPTVAMLVTAVLWVPVLVVIARNILPPSTLGGAGALIPLLLTGLYLGALFAFFTGDWRAIPWMTIVTIGCGILAFVDLQRNLGLAVFVWHTVTAAGLIAWVQTYRAAMAARAHLCAHCSYDLRGLAPGPAGQLICPECGHTRAPSAPP